MNRKKTDRTRYEQFKEAARQLGCDEDDAAFDEKLKRLGKAKAPSDRSRPQRTGEGDRDGLAKINQGSISCNSRGDCDVAAVS